MVSRMGRGVAVSIMLLNRGWRFSKAKGGDLLVLLAIADFANDEGVAYPSIATLARKARLTSRNTQRAIRRLVTNGELLIEEGKGPHRTHLYRIILAESLKSERCQNGIVTNCQDDIRDRERVIFQPYNPSEETVRKIEMQGDDKRSPSRPTVEAVESNLIPPVDPEFEEFWRLYPSRGGKKPEKKAAQTNFSQLSTGDRQLVIVAVRHYAESGRWPKDPHRWLRTTKGDEPWRDWIEPETQAVTPQKKCARHTYGGTCEEYAMPGSVYCVKHKADIVAIQKKHGLLANYVQ